MTRIEVVQGADESGTSPPAAHLAVSGTVHSSSPRPASFSLGLATLALGDGATVTWDGPHGDEVVYVAEGAIEVDGQRCLPGGVVVVESGARARVESVGPSRVVWMGPSDPRVPDDGLNGPPEADGHGVHVVGPGGTWLLDNASGFSRYFADSTCPTCRLTLLMVCRDAAYTTVVHSHTQDELIYVVAGSILVGRRELRPGDTLAVAADTRYRFRSGTDGFTVLNYRRDASEQHFFDGRSPLLEGAAVNGFQRVSE